MRALLLAALLLLTSVSYAKDYPDGEIGDLANSICSRVTLAHNTGTSTSYKVFEGVISNFLNIKSDDSAYRLNAVIKFWNHYGGEMICTEELVGYTSPQHVLKRIIELDAVSSFYFEYFLKHNEFKINFIESVDGKPETLLDYIDKILAMPNSEVLYNVYEIKQLRALITKMMNAKHAKDLALK